MAIDWVVPFMIDAQPPKTGPNAMSPPTNSTLIQAPMQSTAASGLGRSFSHLADWKN